MKGPSKNTVLTIGAVLVFVAVLYAVQNISQKLDGFEVPVSSNHSGVYGSLLTGDTSKLSWWQKILYYLARILLFIVAIIVCLIALLVTLAAMSKGY